MIESMTGYGKSVLQLPSKKVTIEIKSLNSKNLDLNTRVPHHYKEKELDIRKKLAKNLIRGKVDFCIKIENTSDNIQTSLNKQVIKKYIEELKTIVDSKEINFLEMAIQMPDALKNSNEELNEDEWKIISEQIDQAIQNILRYRKEEALPLEIDLKERIKNIQKYLIKTDKLDKERLQNIKIRLKKAIDELKITIDENRFKQELIYHLERLDINEEKIRLESHLEYFLKELKNEKSDGKKLGFIVQEIGREINTMGAKSNYAKMQQEVVLMKNELEKIKEQLFNVL